MRSDSMKRAMERAPHRSLAYAPGCDEQDATQSLIGIVNSYSEIVTGLILIRFKCRATM